MKLLKHALILVFLISAVAFGQDEQTETTASAQSYQFSAGAGIAVPYLPKDFSDISDNGLHFEGGFGMLMSPGDLGYSAISLYLGFDNFDGKASEILNQHNLPESTSTASGGGSNIFTAQVEYRGVFTLHEMFQPYFSAGIGLEHFSSDDISIKTGAVTSTYAGSSRTTFAWNFTIGADIPLNETFSIYLQDRFFFGVGEEILTQHFTPSAGVRIKL